MTKNIFLLAPSRILILIIVLDKPKLDSDLVKKHAGGEAMARRLFARWFITSSPLPDWRVSMPRPLKRIFPHAALSPKPTLSRSARSLTPVVQANPGYF